MRAGGFMAGAAGLVLGGLWYGAVAVLPSEVAVCVFMGVVAAGIGVAAVCCSRHK